jgi:hypothetical protein
MTYTRSDYESPLQRRPSTSPPASINLGPAELAAAVRANRVLARQLGWGCVIGGRVRANLVVRFMVRSWRALLAGLFGGVSNEEDLAHAIARWQAAELRQRATGHLDARTWAEMVRRGALPRRTYEPRRWSVTFSGGPLGVIEKTAPYVKVETPGVGGAGMQLGFRVTDMQAVRRAGFITAAGEPFFRWIQVVEFIRQTTPPPGTPLAPGATVHFVRRAGRQVDPTLRSTPPAPQDPFPYYWDEVAMPPPLGATYLVTNFMHRTAPNGLCYDLIFSDWPRVNLAALAVDLPGRRDYNNYELALVGVRPGTAGASTRIVILNTILWGYDIVFEGGIPRVRLSALRQGPRGGTPAFRATLATDIRAGRYPGHCFVGNFPSGARCP